MDRAARKAAVAAYREKRPAHGVFAVICNATGEVWVGTSGNLDSFQNRLCFGLRLGSSPHKALQAAWTAHGEATFRFEELDRLREDFPALSRRDELKKRQALWQARLQAKAL